MLNDVKIELWLRNGFTNIEKLYVLKHHHQFLFMSNM